MATRTLQIAALRHPGPVEPDTSLFRMLQLVARRVAKRLRNKSETILTVEPRQEAQDRSRCETPGGDAQAE